MAALVPSLPEGGGRSEKTTQVLNSQTLQQLQKLKAECPSSEHLFSGSDETALEFVMNIAAGYKPLGEALAYYSRPSPLIRAMVPALDRVMDRTLFILYLKRRFGYTSFLEIGCRSDSNFTRVPFADKVGVDPVAGGNVRATSDEYFATLCTRTFDLIFIDGLHQSDQVVRDAQNAMRFLNPNGTLLFHDCKPLFQPEGTYPMPQGACFWNGTVWQAIAHLRSLPQIDVVTCDFDWGIGVVRVAPNTNPIALSVPYNQLTWSDYVNNVSAYLRPSTMTEVDAWLGAQSAAASQSPGQAP